MAQSTETSVTSGEQPAAILGTNVATNTFQTRKARTGNRGSLELGQLSAPAVRREAVSESQAPSLTEITSPELTPTLYKNGPEQSKGSALEHSGFNAGTVRLMHVT